MVKSKNAFWQALVFSIIVFLVGVFFGFVLENNRVDNLQGILLKSEVNLLDEQLKLQTMEKFNVSCETSKEGLFALADKIYSEAKQLEKYDKASKFSDGLKILHRRYDLLRYIVFSESILLQERCDSDFHTISYFYQYQTEDLDIKAKQLSFSRVLEDLKNKYPDKILLIPIAGDMDLGSIDLILAEKKINSLPVIIVDFNETIEEISDLESIEKIVFKDNKQ